MMRALLPDAPNPKGWPYRLMITWEEKAWVPWQEGLVTHALSIMPPGGHHFRLGELGAARFKVWLPFEEGRSLAQVVDDELAYIEHVVDDLPADAALLVFSWRLGAPALAVVTGLLARQVGWEKAGELGRELRQTIPLARPPTPVLLEAWRQRLAVKD